MQGPVLGRFLTCPTWHRPLLKIVPGGIEVKCKSCPREAAHFFSQAELIAAWEQMAREQRAPEPSIRSA